MIDKTKTETDLSGDDPRFIYVKTRDFELVDKLLAVLRSEPDQKRQMVTVELFLATFIKDGAPDLATACHAIEWITRHVQQIITGNIHTMLDGKHRRP